MVVTIDWNENIDVKENSNRVMELAFTDAAILIIQTNNFIGEQDFIFNRDYDQTYTQSKIYIKSNDYSSYDILRTELNRLCKSDYPEATVIIGPQENIFEKIFSATEASLIVRLSLLTEKQVPSIEKVQEIRNRLDQDGLMLWHNALLWRENSYKTRPGKTPTI